MMYINSFCAMPVHTHKHTCAHMHACTYIHMHTHTHTHTHILVPFEDSKPTGLKADIASLQYYCCGSCDHIYIYINKSNWLHY